MAILPPVSDRTSVTRGASTNQLKEAGNNAVTTLQDVLSVLASKHPELQAQLAQINQKLGALDVDIDAAIAKVEKSDAKSNEAIEKQIPAIKDAVNEAISGLTTRFGQVPKVDTLQVYDGKLRIQHELHWSDDPGPLTAKISEMMARKFPGIPFSVDGNGLE